MLACWCSNLIQAFIIALVLTAKKHCPFTLIGGLLNAAPYEVFALLFGTYLTALLSIDTLYQCHKWHTRNERDLASLEDSRERTVRKRGIESKANNNCYCTAS